MSAACTRRALTGSWRVRLTEPGPGAPVPGLDLPARVPGCVHLDLLAERLIPDPLVDRNEELQHWVGESGWEYRLDFQPPPVPPGRRADLVFDGLDTVATVWLNGTRLASVENMHRRYRIEVTGALRPGGENRLVVRFAAPAIEAAARRDRLGDLPNPYRQPYQFLRKMACNFGWDWGPRLTTAGIWRPVWLETWAGARLAAVRPAVRVLPAGTGIVDLAVAVERHPPDAGAVTVRAELAGAIGPATATSTIPAVTAIATATATVPAGQEQVRLRLAVPDATLWWPAGRGAQTRYPLTVTSIVDGQVTDRVERRIGFRTVELDTTPDPDGSRWALRVNGERLWVRGFNWIPDDPFPSRVGRDRYADRIDAALAAHANLLRVWGGGIYESDDFYDLCDERGLLVWQDFAFACAAYPEPALTDEVRQEAIEAINRLMHHPSLALWCGNNECLLGWWDWDWQEPVGDRAWGLGWYADLLPDLVAAYDPGRPYLVGSPAAGDLDRHPNHPGHGPSHLWDVWNQRDYPDYRAHRPRFVAEFGFQAPAARSTLAGAVTARPLALRDPALRHHQKATDGEAKLDRWLTEQFGSVPDFEDWHFLAQLNQARALELGVGHLRRLHQHCSGVVWWQLNDCWPAISWSVVDSAGRRKLAWYAARRAYADRLLVVEPAGGELSWTAVNDSRTRWSATLHLQRVELSGTVLAKEAVPVEVGPDAAASQPLPAELATPADPARELLVASLDDLRTCWAWVRDRELAGPRARWQATVQTGPGRLAVTVTAQNLIRDLCLLADRIDPDAVVDSQLVTLLPGERHRFEIRVPGRADWRATHWPVLRAANDRPVPGPGPRSRS